MPDKESPTGGSAAGSAGGDLSVGGVGPEGHSALGGAGSQTRPPRALFVGHIFPAPLDKDGRLVDQSLKLGLGEPHLVSVVYAYDRDAEGEKDKKLHAHLDEALGQPYFKAYIYPVTDVTRDFAVGGVGPEGRSALGGASFDPIYLGHIRATLPDTGDSGTTPVTGGGTTPAPGGGTPPATGGGGAPPAKGGGGGTPPTT